MDDILALLDTLPISQEERERFLAELGECWQAEQQAAWQRLHDFAMKFLYSEVEKTTKKLSIPLIRNRGLWKN